MRKRTIHVNLVLNEQEKEHLVTLSNRAGVSQSTLLRCMILGYRLCEKPDPAFYDIQKELCAIGNRVNQLAAKANKLGFINAPMLDEEVKRWREFRLDVSRHFLKPRAG